MNLEIFNAFPFSVFIFLEKKICRYINIMVLVLWIQPSFLIFSDVRFLSFALLKKCRAQTTVRVRGIFFLMFYDHLHLSVEIAYMWSRVGQNRREICRLTIEMVVRRKKQIFMALWRWSSGCSTTFYPIVLVFIGEPWTHT